MQRQRLASLGSITLVKFSGETAPVGDAKAGPATALDKCLGADPVGTCLQWFDTAEL